MNQLYNRLMMKEDANIYLVGPMGSGKTTIGKLLAQLLNYSFYDVDQLVIEKSGVEISWIFEQEGELGFRKREHNALKSLANSTKSVIATGGGCVNLAKNRVLLKQGFVIYLKVSLTEQLTRITPAIAQRPLFAKNTSPEQLSALNQEREPFYELLADLILETDAPKPAQLARQIQTYLHHSKTKG